MLRLIAHKATALLLVLVSVGTESGAHGKRSQQELWDDMKVWRFGHPRGVLLPTGEVLVVFYAGDDKFLDIRWARIAA